MSVRLYDEVCPVCTARAVLNGTCRECGHKQPTQENDDAPTPDDTDTYAPDAPAESERVDPEPGGVVE